MDRTEMQTRGKEWNKILKALGNETKRTLITYIGLKGKTKGGNDELVKPAMELADKYGFALNPFSLPPKLSELKNKDKLVEIDEDGYWTLTKNGKTALHVMLYIKENLFEN